MLKQYSISSYKQCRGAKLSNSQKDFMVEFMIAHSDFAKGKFCGSRGRETQGRLWGHFTEEANKKGPHKDICQWQKAWNDMKCRARAKVAAIRTSQSRTGNLPNTIPSLSENERKVVELIGKESCEGTATCDSLPTDQASLELLMDGELSILDETPTHFDQVSTPDQQEVHDTELGLSTSAGPSRSEDAASPKNTGKRALSCDRGNQKKSKTSFKEESRKKFLELQEGQNKILEVDLFASYEILQVLDAGWFGQVLLAEPKEGPRGKGPPGGRHRRESSAASDAGGGCEVVLKAVRKGQTSREDFLREYHYSVELGKRHKGILRTLGPPFETATLLVFPLEAAPLGDLASHLSDRGVGGGERPTKAVARQLASALAYMRQRASLVHRDVRPQRVLLFASDCSRVKLSGFGEARPSGTLVRRRRGKEWPPYAPPEVVAATTRQRVPSYYDDISEAASVYFGEEDDLSLCGDSLVTSAFDEGAPPYQAHPAQDAWMLAVTLLVCLTGCLPWTRASATEDPRYARYLRWRTGTARRVSALVLGGRGGPPTKAFRVLSARAQRMFRRLLDPRPEKRPPVEEVVRYVDERWLARSALGDGKDEDGLEEDSDLCPSLYSFHSSPEEKNKLLKTLTEYGVETTVDRSAKKDRIREWVQTSGVIPEEDEEEEEEENSSAEGDGSERHLLRNGTTNGRHAAELKPPGRALPPATPEEVRSENSH